jgi:hypothetical protein
MSRAEVLRDKLLELAEGDRSKAGEVLGELFALDPGLLTEGLARAARGREGQASRKATQIAAPWGGSPTRLLRYELLRPGVVVANVERRTDRFGNETWSIYIWVHGVQRGFPEASIREEAQAGADAALRAEGWRLLPQPAAPG